MYGIKYLRKKSTNNNVVSNFFARTSPMIQWIVRIYWLGIDFSKSHSNFSSEFSRFQIEKTSIINLDSNISKDYASGVLSDSVVIFLGKVLDYIYIYIYQFVGAT